MSTSPGTAGGGSSGGGAGSGAPEPATLAPPSDMHGQVFRALANGQVERVHACLDVLEREGDSAGQPLAQAWLQVVHASLLAGEEIRSGRSTAGFRASPGVCARTDALLLDARQVFGEVLAEIDLAAALIRIAEVAVVLGRLDLAIDATAESAGLLNASRIRNSFVAGCLTRTANLLGELDLVPLGVRYMRQAYDISRTLDIPGEVAHRAHQLAGMSCEAGEILLSNGEEAAARQHFTTGRDLSEALLGAAQPSAYDASLQLALGWAYVGLDDARAFAILNNLRHGSADERPWIRPAADLGLGRAYRRAGHPRVALTHYAAAQAGFRLLGIPRALRSVTREFGETYVESNEPNLGLPAMRRYLDSELARDADKRALCSALFDRRRSVVEDERAASQLRRLAFEDPLTGLPNRRFAESRLKALFEADRTPVLAVVDIDELKQVNDSAGHVVGDLVLQEVAEVIAHQCRQSDDVCRWAGDEFIILMADTKPQHAVIALERVRQAVAVRDWTRLGLSEPVTVSIGVASASREDDGQSLFAAADGLLYAAKREGRNRVARSSGAPESRSSDQLPRLARGSR